MQGGFLFSRIRFRPGPEPLTEWTSRPASTLTAPPLSANPRSAVTRLATCPDTCNRQVGSHNTCMKLCVVCCCCSCSCSCSCSCCFWHEQRGEPCVYPHEAEIHCAGALDGKELFTIEGSKNWRSTLEDLEEREKFRHSRRKTHSETFTIFNSSFAPRHHPNLHHRRQVASLTWKILRWRVQIESRSK